MTRPVDQAKRKTILDALTGDPFDYFEIGTPPYSVGFLSRSFGIDPSNLRKMLLRMEKEGLAVSEYRETATWNAIAQDHIQRKCLCFWNSATMIADKAAAAEWNAGAGDRSREVFDKLFQGSR